MEELAKAYAEVGTVGDERAVSCFLQALIGTYLYKSNGTGAY